MNKPCTGNPKMFSILLISNQGKPKAAKPNLDISCWTQRPSCLQTLCHVVTWQWMWNLPTDCDLHHHSAEMCVLQGSGSYGVQSFAIGWGLWVFYSQVIGQILVQLNHMWGSTGFTPFLFLSNLFGMSQGLLWSFCKMVSILGLNRSWSLRIWRFTSVWWIDRVEIALDCWGHLALFSSVCLWLALTNTEATDVTILCHCISSPVILMDARRVILAVRRSWILSLSLWHKLQVPWEWGSGGNVWPPTRCLVPGWGLHGCFRNTLRRSYPISLKHKKRKQFHYFQQQSVGFRKTCQPTFWRTTSLQESPFFLKEV